LELAFQKITEGGELECVLESTEAKERDSSSEKNAHWRDTWEDTVVKKTVTEVPELKGRLPVVSMELVVSDSCADVVGGGRNVLLDL